MEWVRSSSVFNRLNGSRKLRKSMGALAIGVPLVAALLIFIFTGQKVRLLPAHSSSCQFPAIFNFGDSNSDTGSVSAAFGRLKPPYGETFFGKPSGRCSDGRLIIDFLAEELGVPYLSAYIDSIGTNFSHGANYAASGSTIQHLDAKLYAQGFNPFSLDIQLAQFEQFKARTNELFNQAIKDNLPRPEDFSRALYTIDIGQNDLHALLTSMTEEQAHASIPNIIDQFSLTVEKLYKLGARAFWIHNTGPIGCLPFFVVNYPPKPGNADQNGCVKSYNVVAQAFNNQLRDRISRIREKLEGARIIYVDIYSAKYSLISNAKKYGFLHPLGYCCGKIGIVHCGGKAMVNGTEEYWTCGNPANYISWDGVHYTEAANKWVANHILNVSFSDPRVPIAKACEKPSPPLWIDNVYSFKL